MSTTVCTPAFANGSAAILFNMPGLSFKGMQREKGPVYGERWILQFEGFSDSVLLAYNVCPTDFTARIDPREGPVHGLTIITPDDPTQTTSSVVSRTFQLLGNTSQNDIREHPIALQLGSAKIQIIDDVLKGNGNHTMGDIDPSGDMLTLYNSLLQRNGSMAFQDDQFVFKCSIIASRRSDYTIAYANKNKLYTFAQVKAETLPPAGYVISLDQIEAQCAPTIIPTGYKWRWMKSSPTVDDAPGNKLRISFEYILAVWESWVYADAV